MTATWEASLGDIDFSPAAQHDEVEVTVYGLQRGKHTRITAVADSLIQDGSIERVVRDDNRDVQLILCLDGTDSEALAQFEATLFREVNKGRNEFRWTPPDGFGAMAVFDVLWADLQFADEGNVWDLDEIRGRRNYVLTMRCLPFARSVEPFTRAGVTSGATVVTETINDATTTTDWYGEPEGGGTRYTPGLSSGRVTVAASSGLFTKNPSLVYAPPSAVSMSGTSYFVVTWQVSGNLSPYNDDMEVFADGAPLARLGAALQPGGEYNGPYKTTFLCSDTSVSEFVINPPPLSSFVAGSPDGRFEIDKIEKTNQAPSTGTLRQKATAIDVPGSARTPASLEVSHASSGLGNVLVYTSPALVPGQTPALSPFRTGTLTTDANLVSGKYFNGSPTVFVAPVALFSAGLHQMVIRAQPGTYAVEASLRVGGVDVGPVQAGGSSAGGLLADDSAGYSIYTLGTLDLPPLDVPAGSTANVRITVTRTSGTGIVDEVWAFHMPDDGTAHLSAIPAGARTRIWLDAPTVDRPYPMAYAGNAADKSDAYAPDGSLSNWDEHIFPAGSNEVFVVTTTALDAQVELEGHARWLTHPAA